MGILDQVMQDEDREAFAEAAVEIIKEQFEKLPRPRYDLTISGRDLEPPVVHNQMDMDPIAKAIDRMTYEMANAPKPESHFDVSALVELARGLFQIVQTCRDELEQRRKEAAAQSEMLAKLFQVWSAHKPPEVNFNPTITAAESSVVAAFKEHNEALGKLLAALMEKKPEKLRARKLKIIHGEKESTVEEA